MKWNFQSKNENDKSLSHQTEVMPVWSNAIFHFPADLKFLSFTFEVKLTHAVNVSPVSESQSTLVPTLNHPGYKLYLAIGLDNCRHKDMQRFREYYIKISSSPTSTIMFSCAF